VVTALDARGLSARVEIASGVAGANHLPTLALAASGTITAPGGSLSLTALASDPDGDVLTLFWTSPAGTLSQTSGSAVVWTAPPDPLVATVSCRVEDGYGGSAVASITLLVTTVPNTPPVITSRRRFLPSLRHRW
jgi:hypothetical protein